MRDLPTIDLAVRSPVGPLRFASACYGAGAVASLALAFAWPVVPLAGGVATLACGVQALRLWRRARRQVEAEHLPTDLPAVQPPATWRADHLYLGEGTWWHQPQAARLAPLLRSAPDRQLQDGPAVGDPRIFATIARDTNPLWLPEVLANRHVLVSGTTGVGKTKFFELLLAQAISSGAGVVVLDPKGDWSLASRALDGCRRAGRGEAFHLLSLAHPHLPRMATYNPLFEVSDPDHLLDRIGALLPRSDGEDFWNKQAQRTGGAVAQTYYWLRRYLAALGGLPEDAATVPPALLALEYLRQHADGVPHPDDAAGAIAAGAVRLPAERYSPAAWTPRLDVLDTWGVTSPELWLAWTLRVVFYHVSRAEPPAPDQVVRDLAPKLLETYQTNKVHPLEDPASPFHAWYVRFVPPQRLAEAKRCIERLRTLIETEIKQPLAMEPTKWMNLHSSLMATMGRFRSDVGRLLCSQHPDIRFSRVVRERQVAYIALGSLVASTAAANVAQAIVEDLKSFIGRRQADGQTQVPLYLFIDEAARIATPALVEILAMARSSGVRVVLAVQTLRGLERNGDQQMAEEITANCNTWVQLQAAQHADAERFTKHLGKVAMVQVSKSISEQPGVGGSGNQLIENFSATAGRQMSEKDIPRVPEEAIKALPAGQAFVSTLGKAALLRFPLLPPPAVDVPAEYGLRVDG